MICRLYDTNCYDFFYIESTEHEINSLMNTALSKLPIFGFALSLEKWRWDFFGDKIKDGKINKRWWDRKFVFI